MQLITYKRPINTTKILKKYIIRFLTPQGTQDMDYFFTYTEEQAIKQFYREYSHKCAIESILTRGK